MINMKSPTVNYIMQQNNGGYQQYPPNYSLGYNGYNGQYQTQQPEMYVYVNGQPQYYQPKDPYEVPPQQYPQPSYGYQPQGYGYQNGYAGYPQQPQYGYQYQQQGIYNPYNPAQQSYTNYYGNQVGYNYYNPALRQQQMEQQRKEAEQRRMQEIEYMKQISRCAHAYNGDPISEEELDRIYNPQDTRTSKEIKEEMEFEKTAHIVQYGQRVDYEAGQAKLYNDIKAYHDKFIDPNADLATFLSQAGNLYVDMLLRQEKHKNRSGLAETYNKQGFKNILNNIAYANGMPNNIEDDVIHLPASIQNKLTESYAERRAQFMNSILNQERRRE